MSAALSGPAKSVGQGMRSGVEAYFQLVNERGGIHGRKLRLIPLDDGYEPAQAARNVHKLLDDEKVFALLGNTGTPTAAVVVPIIQAQHVPFFGAYTGEGLLRKSPPDRYVINFRASYALETQEMVRGLTREAGIKPSEIAFFTQNDAYGDAGFAGGMKALRAIGVSDPERQLHGRYTRNTVDVEGAVAQMLDPSVSPKAVIMVGAVKPCAKFIKLMRKYGYRGLFVNVSFVNADALLDELGAKDAEGVIVTQVVPPIDSDLPGVAEFRERVKAEQRSYVVLEGFLAAKAFCEGLRLGPPDLTADQFIDAFEGTGKIELGLGTQFWISPTDHELSEDVWPTIVRAGKFRALRTWKDAVVGGRVG
ncbi:MAG: ABC transporter substrate-binding protein [Deltaproteobacteria bacterium]|nr:ABC transporter substrate-binding protein [Deltaproteobacteria bacterium]